MSICFSTDLSHNRVAKLENEVDLLKGKPQRNRYTCSVCYGRRQVDESFHGSPDFQPCSACKGGQLIDEANAKLDEEYRKAVAS